ncbi:hypothetical protein [Oceanirhabdus sp. W0125-5]|uniref:hypothetical protein n=1 Tax=Oceanirhabdus sp. W0125-5 TaxID=2999116 RepID=UPI0022F2C004|nr:hypothetical protein [Oceanirhabdus sp. W0125-5]WBW94930.1 hypothetical protein OW730_14625 [Oceanirhabdus sp. W0125-5]
MEKAKKCIVIIKDDFKNVFLVQKKGKRTEPKMWQLLEVEVSGRSTEDKSIEKMIKKNISSILFNKTAIKDYVLDEETGDILRIYTGQLKERITLHKDFVKNTWIGENKLEDMDIIPEHKEILKDYFNTEI